MSEAVTHSGVGGLHTWIKYDGVGLKVSIDTLGSRLPAFLSCFGFAWAGLDGWARFTKASDKSQRYTENDKMYPLLPALAGDS
jgi:hypothetical protein